MTITSHVSAPAETGALERWWQSPHPLNLQATLAQQGRSSFDPTYRRVATGPEDVRGIWRTMLTPLGGASLQLRVVDLAQGAASAQSAADASSTMPIVHARAWGDGAAWALEKVPLMLGAYDSPERLDLSDHAELAERSRRHPGVRLSATGLLFEALVPAIIEQKVTTVEAKRGWSALLRKYGEPAPGSGSGSGSGENFGNSDSSGAGVPAGMFVPPSADAWRRIPSWDWHQAGVDPQRARTVVIAASEARFLERDCDAATLERESLTTSTTAIDRLATRLQSIPGIGAWTIAETLQRSHGDPDRFSIGDYHLAHRVGFALTGKRTDDAGMVKLLAPFAGQRHRAVRLILSGGAASEPRRGPRMSIQDHRGH